MSWVIDRELPGGVAASAGPAGIERRSGAGAMPWMSGLLDQIDYGLVVLDESATAVHVNRAARDWIGSPAAPLRLQRGRLEALAEEESGQLRKALAAAVSRGLRALLSFGSGRDGIVAALGPMARHEAAGPALALLVIGRRQVCEALTVQLYASRHGLTYAESHVLELLCSGLSPAEIASRQEVAVSTVRTQVGSIRAKTGARTIGALVREVALLPPLVQALRPAAVPAPA